MCSQRFDSVLSILDLLRSETFREDGYCPKAILLFGAHVALAFRLPGQVTDARAQN